MFGECVPKLGDVVFYLHISSSYNMLEAAVGSYIGLRSTIFLEAPILASKCWFVARKWKGRRDPTNLARFPWHGGFSFWSCLGHSLRSQLGPWSNLQNGWAALGVVLYFEKAPTGVSPQFWVLCQGRVHFGIGSSSDYSTGAFGRGGVFPTEEQSL